MAVQGSIHLLHVFPSFEVGGIQARTSAIINNLDDRFRHSIVALNGDYSCAARLSSGAPVRLLTNVAPPSTLAKSFHTAWATLRAANPDILLTYNWASLDWALTNGVQGHLRHIHHEDGFNVDEAENQFRRRIAYRRLSLLRNDLLIVPSQNLYEIARKVWKRPEVRIRLVPNGVDWREYTSAAKARPSPEVSPAVVLGAIAPLRPEKNIEALLRIVAELQARHSLELTIIGDGPERRRLEALAGELGLSKACRFQGLRHDVADAMAPIDIFMMPSKTEQMPISLLQAMASAKPVVAYDVGDIAHMVSADNGPYIVPREDEQALARCTEQLIVDAALRRKIGEGNLERVKEQFAASTMFERYTACYLDVLASKR